MESYEILIFALLIASAACFLTPLLLTIGRNILSCINKTRDKAPSNLDRSMIIYSAFLIASIWSLRFAVGYYQIKTEENILTTFEEIVNSLIHTLQTFSMDEDYTSYISIGKMMIADIFGTGSVMICLYGIYATILNFCAPVVGGAIIFEILISIFPDILMRLSFLEVWREKYYFSELNEYSLALISSMNNENRKKMIRPVIIIADNCNDNDRKISSDLASDAKSLGAICIRSDIVHVPKNRWGKKRILLIDENESRNICSLVELSKTMKRRYIANTEIYYLSTSDLHIYIEKQVRENFRQALNSGRKAPDGKQNDSNDGQPVILSVNGNKNLVANLLTNVPLFEPIVDTYNENRKNNRETDLNVTIIGMGLIGTEMLLATYWCGQILNCKLNITVFSKESEDEFKQKIDYLNPEIFASTKENDPLLKIYSKPEYVPAGAPSCAAPYCKITYKTADVKSQDFMSRLYTDDDIKRTNYFLVSLGSDEENISVANRLREVIGQHHVLNDDSSKTVIAYVVFDPEMSSVLNRQNVYSYSKNGNDIYMRAVGALEDVYSVNNIFMMDMYPLADKANIMYNSDKAIEKRKKDSQNIARDEYTYWANMARAVHSKYKVFSSGEWKESIFSADCEYPERQTDYIDNYKKLIHNCIEKKDQRLLNELAWLEHRRWNAFLRTRGFKNPVDAKKFLEKFKTQKNLELKLHLCLVECDKYGMKADMTNNGEWRSYKLLDPQLDESSFNSIHPDMLDEVTYNVAKFKRTDDYKLYDYPLEDFKH